MRHVRRRFGVGIGVRAGMKAGMKQRAAIVISAIVGFLGVALGAFGAHGLRGVLEANGQMENWRTASQYHLIHAVALLAVALHGPVRVWAWRFWFAGIVVFSGSLYVMGLTGQRALGAITPIGGVFLLAGWAAVAMAAKAPAGNAAPGAER